MERPIQDRKMNKPEVIKEVEEKLKFFLREEPTGHGWWHSLRVTDLAKKIAKKEGGDLFVIELAALLHDIDDWKFSKSRPKERARRLMEELGVDDKSVKAVCYIIDNVSFKGALVKDKMETIEGKVVQDADRLDAIGAIGIARTFAYGGFIKREIYNPNITPAIHKNFEDYKKLGPSFNHFFEKILLLKDRLNTTTAKQIAEKRHQFLEDYIKQFLAEWNGKI